MGTDRSPDFDMREARPEDRRGLLDLRRATYGEQVESGNEALFEWQYHRNPAGEALVTVVEMGGEIVGELGALPTRFLLDGSTSTALLYVNFIVRADLRGRGFGPRIDAVQRQRALDRDLWLMLGFVRLSNAPQLRVQTKKLGKVPLVVPEMYYRIERPAAVARAAMGSSGISSVLGALSAGPVALWNAAHRPCTARRGVEVKEMREADESVDRLWASVSRHYRYSVVKDRAFVSWRFFQDPRKSYRVLGAYRGGDLVGLAVARRARWEALRLGVLLELLVEPRERDAADALVGAALAGMGGDVDLVSCMLQARGAAGAALRRAGFVRLPSKVNPHEYLLIGEAMDGRMDLTPLVSAEDWRISWGDFDTF
jgi:hypothetical protein